MYGKWDKCNGRYWSYGEPVERVYESFILKEDRECGEIINDYYLIIDGSSPFDETLTLTYKKGDCVLTVDIRCLDIFSTDINYDNRSDLSKMKTETFCFTQSLLFELNYYTIIEGKR